MPSVPDAEPQAAIRRYSNAAVGFHWITVLLVICQATLGFIFADMARGPERTNLLAWHKTVGALILVVTVIRLGYRLANPPPPYSPDLPRWERLAGTWSHWLLYTLLIVMPLTGLIAVSGRTKGAFTTLILGIPFPVIPGVNRAVGAAFGDIHSALAWVLIVLVLIHAAAALKHQFVDRLPVSGRMPPFRPADRRPVVIGQGGSAGSP